MQTRAPVAPQTRWPMCILPWRPLQLPAVERCVPPCGGENMGPPKWRPLCCLQGRRRVEAVLIDASTPRASAVHASLQGRAGLGSDTCCPRHKKICLTCRPGQVSKARASGTAMQLTHQCAFVRRVSSGIGFIV